MCLCLNSEKTIERWVLKHFCAPPPVPRGRFCEQQELLEMEKPPSGQSQRSLPGLPCGGEDLVSPLRWCSYRFPGGCFTSVTTQDSCLTFDEG